MKLAPELLSTRGHDKKDEIPWLALLGPQLWERASIVPTDRQGWRFQGGTLLGCE